MQIIQTEWRDTILNPIKNKPTKKIPKSKRGRVETTNSRTRTWEIKARKTQEKKMQQKYNQKESYLPLLSCLRKTRSWGIAIVLVGFNSINNRFCGNMAGVEASVDWRVTHTQRDESLVVALINVGHQQTDKAFDGDCSCCIRPVLSVLKTPFICSILHFFFLLFFLSLFSYSWPLYLVSCPRESGSGLLRLWCRDSDRINTSGRRMGVHAQHHTLKLKPLGDLHGNKKHSSPFIEARNSCFQIPDSVLLPLDTFQALECHFTKFLRVPLKPNFHPISECQPYFNINE